jgi:serine/threonine protein phosphatase PrpC
MQAELLDDEPIGALIIGAPGRAATELPPGPPILASVPDIALTAANTTRIEIRAASVRGLQHRAATEPRQDAFGLQLARRDDDGEELIAVVCDGVGSLPRSHEAAAMVALRLAELGRDGCEWVDAFGIVNGELGARAYDQDSPDSAPLVMATTAVALRVRCDEAGWRGKVGRVGDSALWHLDAQGNWTRCTACETDELHSSQSAALPAADLHVDEQMLEFEEGALFLMSDGVGNPLAWVGEVQTTLADRWATPPDVYTFGSQVGFARRTHVDDRTVVGLWMRR